MFIAKGLACWLGSLMRCKQTSATQTVMSALSELTPTCPLLLGTTDVKSFSLLLQLTSRKACPGLPTY